MRSMGSDLEIDFDCNGPAFPPSEHAIEAFLRERHFTVANTERVRRQLNVGFLPLQIEALDGRDISIRFQGLMDNPRGAMTDKTVHYHLSLESPPPTRHDRELEAALRTLVTRTLRCSVVNETVSDNQPEAASFYADILAMQKNRMREAQVCDKTEPTYSAAACAEVPGH